MRSIIELRERSLTDVRQAQEIPPIEETGSGLIGIRVHRGPPMTIEVKNIRLKTL